MIPRGARAAAAGAALLAAAAGCEAAPRAAPCPGALVGTFRFRGAPLPVEGTACASGGDGGLAFTAGLAFGAGATAFLCVERGEAEPLRGGRQGDVVALSSSPAPATLAGCGCPLEVTEEVSGQILRGEDGLAVGFSGELRDAIAPAADGGAACAADAGPGDGGRCAVPCALRWSLETGG